MIEPLSLRSASSGDRRQGTTVRVWPDPKYFDSPQLPQQEFAHLLRSKAVLMPGVGVSLAVEKTGEAQNWLFKRGFSDYLTQALHGEPLIPLFEGDGSAGAKDENFAEGEGASWCVAFTEDGAPVRESYVNLIPTSAGGTHESGLRDGLFNAVKSFIELHALAPKGVKLLPEDVFARASYPAVGQGARSAVPGPDQGAAEFARRGETGLKLRASDARTLAAQPCGLRQEARRTRDSDRADAAEGRPEGRKTPRLGRRGAAWQADRLRKPRHPQKRGISGGRRFGRPAAPRWAATRTARRSCRCAARC